MIRKLFYILVMFAGVLLIVSYVTGTFHIIISMLMRATFPIVAWLLNLLGMTHLVEVYRYIVEVGV